MSQFSGTNIVSDNTIAHGIDIVTAHLYMTIRSIDKKAISGLKVRRVTKHGRIIVRILRIVITRILTACIPQFSLEINIFDMLRREPCFNRGKALLGSDIKILDLIYANFFRFRHISKLAPRKIHRLILFS